MLKWIRIPEKRRLQLLEEASNRSGLPIKSIEKDWWVTIALKAVFATPWAADIIFKGGTSLIKGWGVIERFSEDVDLAIDRRILGFIGPSSKMSRSQVTKLRRKSSEFIVEQLMPALDKALLELSLTNEHFKLILEEVDSDDSDPRTIYLAYHSLSTPNSYLDDKVKIEISSRSLKEPCSSREISSIIDQVFKGASFTNEVFQVMTVDPQRTFIEKIFLLHEMFQQPEEKWKHKRYTRHLYDLFRLMDTDHGIAALADRELYNQVIEHRRIINAVKGVDYHLHQHPTIDFIPRGSVMHLWKEDYEIMRREMFYGEVPEFKVLIDRLEVLQQRIRAIAPALIKLPVIEDIRAN
jgi:predicted nucleotidyltransferase component of viral defense system